jgi:hypothetical protein
MSNADIVHIGTGVENLRPQRLSAEFPAEVNFFCRTFIWPCNHAGFYTRHQYFKSGDELPWRPYKLASGNWQHLHKTLVLDMAERHLGFDRFCQTHDRKSQLRPRDGETAFWLGLMAGPRTYTDCLDIDSHEVIGWYGLPTRWHPSHWGNSPLAQLAHTDHNHWRYVPVVEMPLGHFKLLRKYHDVFLNRIWALSSANLGLGLWRIRTSAVDTARLYDEVQRQLEMVGLGGTEHYPRPARVQDSLGRCQRRPCGMDINEDLATGASVELRQTVLEEVAHFLSNSRDCTRDLQDWAFKLAVRSAMASAGELSVAHAVAA